MKIYLIILFISFFLRNTTRAVTRRDSPNCVFPTHRLKFQENYLLDAFLAAFFSALRANCSCRINFGRAILKPKPK